ncbi:MAG: glucose 1-dehydrogenase [Desulfitobacteriaceae bacterium]
MNTNQLFDLTGQTAIVTGGYTGLGWQISEALIEQGANVVICARNGEKCQEAAVKLSQTKPSGKVIGVKCDIAKEEDVEKLVQTTLDNFGAIDILVNNAGITWGEPAEKMKLKNWEQVLKVNLNGTFLCTQKVGTEMLKRKYGKIINISSVTALKGVPYMDALSYVTSKGGLISFTKDLAVKWAPYGVYVNAIAPGFFGSHMVELFFQIDGKQDSVLDDVPLRKIGGSDDLKGAVVFLASAASNFVTGIVLPVDGGMSAR